MPVTPVIPDDTPNAGRVIYNNNDDSLQADVDTVDTDLTAHKGSNDHDARYYTETEIDVQQAAQDAALDTHKASADHDSRYYTEAEVDALLLQSNENSSYMVHAPSARAAGAAGNTPTPLNDFNETSAVRVLKQYGSFLKRSIDKKLVLVGRGAHSTGGGNSWRVDLDAIAEDGITTVTDFDSDNNAAGTVVPNLRIELDISSLPDDEMCQWSIYLRNIGTGTATMFAQFSLYLKTTL